ncbi:hypothetical protein HDF26_003259 [Pedobacter cryoconitis]|uniref:Carboxypeptidase-like protein n=1 Tax=Pedobacter cryoconitis TaxID=188932 RepID=A0A7W8ZLL4_9SPHI|nr:hypothetical protein [Pedobacter cryoconitis]MBB5636284.1 hypothetical protein [Pedobacter cryoconitis]MBB6272799.1 hypothetical protein [Pedobacter cryoconitis]
MKYIWTLVFVFCSYHLFAQRITGTVLDKDTRLPIENATITTGYGIVFTNPKGDFGLSDINAGEVIKVSRANYVTYYFTLKANKGNMVIMLEAVPLILQEVRIEAKNKYQFDSLRNRQDFRPVFAYKGPKIQNILLSKSAYVRSPRFVDRNLNPGSTTSIAGIDVLQFINLLGKDKNQTSRLQKTLLTTEDNNYVDKIFSKSKISRVTSLKGDALQQFINRYRPSRTQAEEMSDYELIIYIKKSYSDFTKTGTDLPALK